uniref:Reverse transcriptase domain-containing protein n=1 Tax=Tanacetum cinerariifolium TaxID=118510 RepID=A0A6L2N6M1_TANCI|nr:hypothetical protein [Tanacetum cinerariifolium]
MRNGGICFHFQKEQEEQTAQSFTPYWNSPMIDDEEVLLAREKLMEAIQTFLQKFSRYPFGAMPKVLLIAWERLSEIKHAFTDKQYQPEEIQELMSKLLEDVRNINEELSDYTNSSSWNRPIFYDNDEHSKEYLENSSKAITLVLPTEEPNNSLNMEDEHLSTILETESDELIKSSVENLVPIPSESEVTSDNENSLFDSSSKVDYLEELSGELIPTSIINDEHIKREHEEYINLMEKLLTINAFPRPLENFHANTIIETLSTSPILVEDSDSLREEIDIFTGTDDLMPPGIESDDYDSKGNIHFLEELLRNDSIPLLENESSNFDHHDDPSFPHPPPKPPDVEVFFDFEPNSGELISTVMNKIDELNEMNVLTQGEVSSLLLSIGNEDTIFDPGIST